MKLNNENENKGKKERTYLDRRTERVGGPRERNCRTGWAKGPKEKASINEIKKWNMKTNKRKKKSYLNKEPKETKNLKRKKKKVLIMKLSNENENKGKKRKSYHRIY